MEYLEINGWKIYFHPSFTAQITQLAKEVLAIKAIHPNDYHKKRSTKLLAAIVRIISEHIAADPLGSQFRQGDTLGEHNKHWFRAKFLQQYRLFYRCSEQYQTIVIGWVNDENTLRAYNSKSDAYKTFVKMLKAGNPPGEWEDLLKEAKAQTAQPFYDALTILR